MQIFQMQNLNKSLNNTSINTDNDTEISVSEAENYSGVIDVSSLSITDLSGIEAFKKITRLYCFGNQIKHLDVTNNNELERLYCNQNKLVSLMFLEIVN